MELLGPQGIPHKLGSAVLSLLIISLRIDCSEISGAESMTASAVKWGVASIVISTVAAVVAISN